VKAVVVYPNFEMDFWKDALAKANQASNLINLLNDFTTNSWYFNNLPKGRKEHVIKEINWFLYTFCCMEDCDNLLPKDPNTSEISLASMRIEQAKRSLTELIASKPYLGAK